MRRNEGPRRHILRHDDAGTNYRTFANAQRFSGGCDHHRIWTDVSVLFDHHPPWSACVSENDGTNTDLSSVLNLNPLRILVFQVHVIADQPEAVEMLLHDRQIRFEQDERRYRLADGREVNVALLCVEVDAVGLDIAVFDAASERNPPLSPIDGKPARRLLPDQVRALLDASND